MATVNPCKYRQLPDLINDTRLTLSHVESGCIVYQMQGEVHLIIKDTPSKISSFSSLRSVKLKFTSILKSEFPSLHMEIILRNNKDLSGKYEYFIMAESETDTALLSKLRETRHVKLHLYDNENVNSFNIELDEKENESLNRAYGEISHLLTKTSI